MRKTFVYALGAVMSLGAIAETAPLSAAEHAEAGPASLDQLRAKIRSDAMTAMAVGELQTVRHNRYHRRYHPRRRYAKRRWCGYRKYYGRRCYYTPLLLKPFRQR